MALFAKTPKTVDGIISSLTQIKKDLEIHDEEKDKELEDLNQDKKLIDDKIDYADKEKTRGNVIFKNISNLLGEEN